MVWFDFDLYNSLIDNHVMVFGSYFYCQYIPGYKTRGQEIHLQKNF